MSNYYGTLSSKGDFKFEGSFTTGTTYFFVDGSIAPLDNASPFPEPPPAFIVPKAKFQNLPGDPNLIFTGHVGPDQIHFAIEFDDIPDATITGALAHPIAEEIRVKGTLTVT